VGRGRSTTTMGHHQQLGYNRMLVAGWSGLLHAVSDIHGCATTSQVFHRGHSRHPVLKTGASCPGHVGGWGRSRFPGCTACSPLSSTKLHPPPAQRGIRPGRPSWRQGLDFRERTRLTWPTAQRYSKVTSRKVLDSRRRSTAQHASREPAGPTGRGRSQPTCAMTTGQYRCGTDGFDIELR